MAIRKTGVLLPHHLKIRQNFQQHMMQKQKSNDLTIRHI